MILIDTRAGSNELIEIRGDKTFLIGTLIPVTPTTLKSGDLSFLGNGPNSTFVPVGVEYKKLRDVLNCICDGRFSGTQLPGLIRDFGSYNQYWLVIEGQWRGNPVTGLLERQWLNPYSNKWTWAEVTAGSRKFTALEFNSWLMTMQNIGGVRVMSGRERSDCIQQIQALYSWWVNKDYSDHRSHLKKDESGVGMRLIHKPVTQAERCRRLCEDVAECIEGIGSDKAKRVADYYKTVSRMVNAKPKEWMEITGIGKVITDRLMRDIGQV